MRTSLLFSLCCFLFFLVQTHQQHPETIIKGITTNPHTPHEINLIQNKPFSHTLTENKKMTKLTLDLSFQILDFSNLQQEPSNLFALIIQPSDYDPPVDLFQLTYSSKENSIEFRTQGNQLLFKDYYHSHNISKASFEFLATVNLENTDMFSLLSTSDRLTKSVPFTTQPNYTPWKFDKTTKILICGQGITCYIDSLVLWYDYSAGNFGELAQLIASGTSLFNLSPNALLNNNTPPETENNDLPFPTKISPENNSPIPHYQRLLGICADATMYYYPDSGTCLTTCEAPYHVDSSITSFKACVVPSSSTFIWNAQQVWKYSKQVAEFLVQISNIIYVGDSAGIRAAQSLRVFYYVRYTEMTYPAELQLVNYAWSSHFLPLGFKFEMPIRSQEDFNLDPIPEEFSRYSLVSSFLINFWAELMICSGITVIWMFIKLFECCFYSKTFSTVRYRATLKIRSIVQNLLLTQLYIVYGDLLFFAVLEYRSLTSLQGLTGLSVLFSAFLLLGMTIGFLLHFLLAGKFSDVHKMIAQNLEGSEQELEKFLYDNQGNKVLFHDFKPDFSQQCFLLFLIFRDLFCSLMATLLFMDPVAQTTLILVANAAFMAYFLIKIPLKNAFHTFQQTIYEVITLTVSVSTFILSILDRLDADAVQTKYNLSRLIIGLSLVLPFIISLFMISPVIYAVWQVFYKEYQRRKALRKLRLQVWAAEQALPTIAVPDKGYYHSYHQTTYTYNQSYTDRPFLQQQSADNNYNSNTQNYDTTFLHKSHSDTMGIQNDSHPHEIQEGYAMTQPDVDPEPEPPLQRALEKKRLYSIAIQEIESVLSLQKDVSTQKQEILRMMNQVINETDEVSKIKTPRKSLAPSPSPPSKLNKSASSKTSKKTRTKISPPKLLFTDYILTDDRIKLKKIESARRAKRIKEAIVAAEKARKKQLATAHRSLSPERQRTDSTPERSSRNPNKVVQLEKSSSYSPSKAILTDYNSQQKPQGILKNSPQRLALAAENNSRSRFSPLPSQNTIRNSPIPTQNTLEAPHNSRETRRDLEVQRGRSSPPQKASYNNLTRGSPIPTQNTIEAPQNSRLTNRDFEQQKYRSSSSQKNYSQSPQKPSQNVSQPKKSNIEILKYVDDSRLEVISVDEGRRSLRDTRTRFRGVGKGMNDTDDYLESVTPKGFSENPRDKFRWTPEKK